MVQKIKGQSRWDRKWVGVRGEVEREPQFFRWGCVHHYFFFNKNAYIITQVTLVACSFTQLFQSSHVSVYFFWEAQSLLPFLGSASMILAYSTQGTTPLVGKSHSLEVHVQLICSWHDGQKISCFWVSIPTMYTHTHYTRDTKYLSSRIHQMIIVQTRSR